MRVRTSGQDYVKFVTLARCVEDATRLCCAVDTLKRRGTRSLAMLTLHAGYVSHFLRRFEERDFACHGLVRVTDACDEPHAVPRHPS